MLAFIRDAKKGDAKTISDYVTDESKQLLKVSQAADTGVCYSLKGVHVADGKPDVSLQVLSEKEGVKTFGIIK